MSVEGATNQTPQEFDELSKLVEKHEQEKQAKWAELQEKLGISSEMIVIDFQIYENDIQKRVALLGVNGRPVLNPPTKFIEDLRNSLPAGVVVNSTDYQIEPIDFNVLKEQALNGQLEGLEVITGKVSITPSNTLYLTVGEKMYWFNSKTANAIRLKKILRRKKLKDLTIDIIALKLDTDENKGTIQAFITNFDEVNKRAKEKRKEIDKVVQPSSPPQKKALRWDDLTEDQKQAFASHYLKLALIYGKTPLTLMDDSLSHHNLARILVEESRNSYKLVLNTSLLQDFLHELGFEDGDRPIMGQALKKAILQKFPELNDILDELAIEAIKPYLAPGHQIFNRRKGEFEWVGRVRVPECIEIMLKDIPHLKEGDIKLFASYVRLYAKGLPTPPDEKDLRQGKRPDARLRLWEWIVKHLGRNNLQLLTTFKKYYGNAGAPFTCPYKEKGFCPYVDEGVIPKCPFVTYSNKVERYIALIDDVEIHAPDAIQIRFGDNTLVIEDLDITKPTVIEKFRAWLIATFVDNFTKKEAESILIGLMDRGRIVKSQYGDTEPLEEFDRALSELAERGVYPWESRNASHLFFSKDESIVYVPTPALQPYLLAMGLGNTRKLKPKLKYYLGRYIVSLGQRLSPIPKTPSSQEVTRPYAILLKKEYFTEYLKIDLEDKKKTSEAETLELPPEDEEEGGA